MSIFRHKWTVEMKGPGAHLFDDFVVKARNKEDAIAVAHYENFKKRGKYVPDWYGWHVTSARHTGRS